ncbi:MAG: hypothetical protein OXR72_21130 [Gemmatimonadota bacterium]|nr:hypothetical protein [Gemmatimonadota bacterium]
MGGIEGAPDAPVGLYHRQYVPVPSSRMSRRESSFRTRIETNIYAKATEKGVDLEEQDRVTATFDFLLRKVEPRLVIAHGREAEDYLQGQDLPCELKCVKHFRFWSLQDARDIGVFIRGYCEGK